MISHTKAYVNLKLQNQESIDFALLTCQAVPALKAYMKAVKKGSAPKLPDPDHFEGEQDFDRFQAIIPNYRKKLGKLLAISFFSYFEAYVKEVIAELFDFHGGYSSLIERATGKRNNFFVGEVSKKKEANLLREYADKKKKQKYQKQIKDLENFGYMFPSELFSVFGLIELEGQSSNFKSVEIPTLLSRCFGISFTEDEDKKFGQYRTLRNDIAHGNVKDVDLSNAFDVGEFFRTLALKIDKHLLQYFFIIEL